ncbi:MAG: hypothetical protein V4492_01180 [Chlamydiota bacterium]
MFPIANATVNRSVAPVFNPPSQLQTRAVVPPNPPALPQLSWKDVLVGKGEPFNGVRFTNAQAPSPLKTKITQNESMDLCKRIRRTDMTFAAAMQSIKTVELNSDLVYAIVQKKIHANESNLWLAKKNLFAQLPDELRIGRNLRCFLSQAVNHGDWPTAQKTYEEACRRNLTDEKTHVIFIQFAKEKGKFGAASAAYNEACGRGQETFITHMVYIDFLVKEGRWQQAESIFNKCRPARTIDDTSGIPMIDLHGYSHGAGLLESLDFLSSTPSTECGLIPGKGRRKEDNYMKFRNYLERHIPLHLPEWSMSRNKYNPGVLLLKK